MGRLQRLNSSRSASFAARDLEAEKAGRPDDAISFYRAARAERERSRKFFAEQGVEHPSNRADAELQRQAISQIIADPLQHLKTSLVFMWRGVPSFNDIVLTPLAFLSLFTMAATGLVRRNAVMLGISLLPAGAFLFYALTSYFEPRYSAPLVPNFILALILAVVWTGGSIGRNSEWAYPRRTIRSKIAASPEERVIACHEMSFHAWALSLCGTVSDMRSLNSHSTLNRDGCL